MKEPMNKMALAVCEAFASYTRSEAIADGVLVDVTETAKMAGLKCPVALTCFAHKRYVLVPSDATWQDESRRLWDVLTMLAAELRSWHTFGAPLPFRVYVRNENCEAAPVTLRAAVGWDESCGLHLVVMEPEED